MRSKLGRYVTSVHIISLWKLPGARSVICIHMEYDPSGSRKMGTWSLMLQRWSCPRDSKVSTRIGGEGRRGGVRALPIVMALSTNPLWEFQFLKPSVYELFLIEWNTKWKKKIRSERKIVILFSWFFILGLSWPLSPVINVMVQVLCWVLFVCW